MGQIGSNPPTSTRAEASDIMVGNFLDENPGITTDITIAGLRRSDLNYDTESISNAVRFLTNGTVKGKFANNGDFDVGGDKFFVDALTGRIGINTTTPHSVASGTLLGLITHMDNGTSDTANFAISGTTASLYLVDNNAAADEKVMRLVNSSGVTKFQTATDAAPGSGGVVANLFAMENSTGNIGIGMLPITSILAINGLPTSASGLVTGEVWNNSGVLTIV